MRESHWKCHKCDIDRTSMTNLGCYGYKQGFQASCENSNFHYRTWDIIPISRFHLSSESRDLSRISPWKPMFPLVGSNPPEFRSDCFSPGLICQWSHKTHYKSDIVYLFHRKCDAAASIILFHSQPRPKHPCCFNWQQEKVASCEWVTVQVSVIFWIYSPIWFDLLFLLETIV